MKRNDIIGAALIILVSVLLLAFIINLFGSIANDLHTIAEHDALASRQTQVCYDHGYSKRLWTDGRAYCYKLVNGTEVVTPVEQVK